jgi:hypothetical protein
MERLSMLRRICALSVTRTISDATQRLMRLNWFDDALDIRAVARVRVGLVIHPGARHQLARSHEHKVASAILPRDLDRVVVEQRAALLRIELVAAVLEHFLGRRLVRRPLAVKRQRRLARRHAVPDREPSRQTSALPPTAVQVGKQLAVRRESRSRSAAAEESRT